MCLHVHFKINWISFLQVHNVAVTMVQSGTPGYIMRVHSTLKPLQFDAHWSQKY